MKLSKFEQVCGTIHRKLRRKTRKKTRIKFYKTTAVPLLLYGSETPVINKKNKIVFENKLDSKIRLT